MKNLNIPILGLVLAATLLGTSAAHADILTLTLSDPTQTASAGDRLEFDATISNPDTDINGSAIWLNGADFESIDPSLQGDASGVFNFLWSFAPGATDSEELFFITVPDGTASGSYSGAIELTGGSDQSAGDQLALTSFTVNVVTPEPSSLLLMFSGLVGMAGMMRRKLTR